MDRLSPVPFIAVIAVVCHSASAAELREVPALTSPMPAVKWSGLYAGGSLGGRSADLTWNTTAVAEGFGIDGGTAPDPVTARRNVDSATGRAGLYAGYNWQIGPSWVAGIEADVAWSRSNKRVAGLPGAEGPVIGYIEAPGDSVGVAQQWDGSLHLRLGFLLSPSVLIYATGGASWLRMEANATCHGTILSWCTVGADRNQTKSRIVDGWTIGTGIETLLGARWLARAEYRFSDYGTLHETFFSGTPDMFSADLRIRTHTYMFGLAYKFGEIVLKE